MSEPHVSPPRKSNAGRKPRKDNPLKVTLYLSSAVRRVGDKLAVKRNQSLSQFVQTLIEMEAAK